MITIYALVWCQSFLSAGLLAHSCLSYGGQPTFSSKNACEAYAQPLRRRIARDVTIECMARIVQGPQIAQ